LEVFLKGQHFGTILNLVWRRKKILQHMREKNFFITGENKFFLNFCSAKKRLCCMWGDLADRRYERTGILSMS